jgi:hypothetical protein
MVRIVLFYFIAKGQSEHCCQLNLIGGTCVIFFTIAPYEIVPRPRKKKGRKQNNKISLDDGRIYRVFDKHAFHYITLFKEGFVGDAPKARIEFFNALILRRLHSSGFITGTGNFTRNVLMRSENPS